MATVPLSIALCEQIRTNATTPFTFRMAEEKKKVETNRELADLIALAQGVNPQHLAAAWLLHSAEPRFFNKYHARVELEYAGDCFTLHLENTPTVLKGYENFHKKLDNLEALPEKWRAVRDHLDTLLVDYNLAKQDKQAVLEALRVLDKVPNLKRALDVMPAIESWVPAEYLARHREKAVRQNNTGPTAEELRAEALTPEALAALARARMSQP